VSEDSRWEPYVRERFEQMAVKDGYDPDFGEYPTPATLALTWDTLRALLPPETPTPNIGPSGEGGVEICWVEYGWYVCIEFDRAGQVLFHMRVDDSNPPVSFEGVEGLADTLAVVAGFLTAEAYR
jgi:hypothetical protein